MKQQFHVIGHKITAHLPTVQSRPWPGAFYDLAYDTREEAFIAHDAIRASCRFGYNKERADAAIARALEAHNEEQNGSNQSRKAPQTPQ